jgi:hypothetical protein
LVGEYVVTQHDCQGRRVAPDSIGLAAYTMDSHSVQRYVRNGAVRNEGDVQVPVSAPYPVSYRAMTPKRGECRNLLVPVCLSASHIAFGSVRMEPVFMILGQSAATAACLTFDQGAGAAQPVAVQDVAVDKLQARLKTDGQRLTWSGSAIPSIDPASLEGVVVDEPMAEVQGQWLPGSAVGHFVGDAYLHDRNESKGLGRVRYPLRVPREGRYEVRLYYTPHANRASNVPVALRHAEGEESFTVNQKTLPTPGRYDRPLGVYRFAPDAESWLEIRNEATDGYVVADAVQLVPEADNAGK